MGEEAFQARRQIALPLDCENLVERRSSASRNELYEVSVCEFQSDLSQLHSGGAKQGAPSSSLFLLLRRRYLIWIGEREGFLLPLTNIHQNYSPGVDFSIP